MATTANDLGLFFSSVKTKVNTSRKSDIFHLGKQPIETVKYYKYLGVTIDAHLSFTKHIADTKHKIYSRLNMIKIISDLKIGLNTKMLVTLYKALIQSIILYGAPVLLLAAPSATTNLEHAYDMYLDSPQDPHQHSCIRCFSYGPTSLHGHPQVHTQNSFKPKPSPQHNQSPDRNP